jgi:serine/threonine protein kinase/TolB-like protein
MSEWKRDPYLGKEFLGRFRLESIVARGGMGAIYRARQLGMDRIVAVKIVQTQHKGDEEITARFRREMKATAAIEHPNTVRVYEFGVAEGGELFLVMELLEGQTLAELVESEGPLPADRAARIAAQIASALAAAHGEKIVHRDLKPENILIVDRYDQKDMVKVVDFGLARFVKDDPVGSVTQHDLRVGTPACMAPEYITTGKAGPSADLYALGVVLFAMVTGRLPFNGHPYDVMRAHVTQPAPSPSSWAPAPLPRYLEELILELLEKKPEKRPATAEDAKNRLDNPGDMTLVAVAGAAERPAPANAGLTTAANLDPRSAPTSERPAASEALTTELRAPGAGLTTMPPETEPLVQPAPRGSGPSASLLPMLVGILVGIGFLLSVGSVILLQLGIGIGDTPEAPLPVPPTPAPTLAGASQRPQIGLLPFSASSGDETLTTWTTTLDAAVSAALKADQRVALVNLDNPQETGNVMAVARGSVRRSGDHMRLIVTLEDPRDGAALWTRTWEGVDLDATATATEVGAAIVENSR